MVPDEQPEIEAALRHWCDERPVDLLVTTGGTGFSPRDVTPEATLAVCDRLTPRYSRGHALCFHADHALGMLSRAQAGIRKGPSL